MSDFPSLNLSTGADGSKKPVLKITSDDVAEKFEKKMQQVAHKEKETESARAAVGSGFQYINLDRFPVSLEAVRQISKEEAERLRAVCFFASQDEFRLGAVDPSQKEVQELLY